MHRRIQTKYKAVEWVLQGIIKTVHETLKNDEIKSCLDIILWSFYKHLKAWMGAKRMHCDRLRVTKMAVKPTKALNVWIKIVPLFTKLFTSAQSELYLEEIIWYFVAEYDLYI